jgi:hypothetical protein
LHGHWNWFHLLQSLADQNGWRWVVLAYEKERKEWKGRELEEWDEREEYGDDLREREGWFAEMWRGCH